MSENVTALTEATFDEVVNSATEPLVVDFWAEWCGPCKTIAPILNEIADEAGRQGADRQTQRRREPLDRATLRRDEHPDDARVRGRRGHQVDRRLEAEGHTHGRTRPVAIGSQAAAAERAADTFLSSFDDSAPVLVRAPGRVNVIGEHTDYNDGFVLPIALPFVTAIAARPRTDERVVVESEGFGAAAFEVADDPRSTDGWARYLHGVAWALAEHLDEGPLPGWDGAVATDIPAGASLSSSAAIEVAATLLFNHLLTERSGSDRTLTVAELARIGQRVENEVMDLPSGLLDQLASAGGTAGHATLIDCRDLSMRSVPFPPSATIVVLDTGTRRELVESEYADRQATCAAAAEIARIWSRLRDATLDDVGRLTDPIAARRVRHVVTENTRTLEAVRSHGGRASSASWVD